MTFYFSANCRDIVQDQAHYERIVSVAASHGWSVNNNWLEAVKHRHDTQDDWRNIFYEAMSGIKHSDALIVEASDQSAFGVGYEVATALQQHLPVLLLCRDGSSSYASGIKHQLIYYREYDSNNLEMQIEKFLRAVGEKRRAAK